MKKPARGKTIMHAVGRDSFPMLVCGIVLLFTARPGAGGSLPECSPVVSATADAPFTLRGGDSTCGQLERVPVEGMPFSRAVRVRTLRQPEQTWDLRLHARPEKAVGPGDLLAISFFARGVASSTGARNARASVLFERACTPWRKSLLVDLPLTKEWQRYQLPFRIKQNWGADAKERYEAADYQLGFNLGFPPQTVEIGGFECGRYDASVELCDLPTTTFSYPGREPDAAWRKAAQERIRTHRMAELVVRVVDERGEPVPDAEVRIEMRRHVFPFGTTVNAWRYLDKKDNADLARYRTKIGELFNRAVLEGSLKWPAWSADRSIGIEIVRRLRELGLAVRGHTLVWPSWRYSPWASEPEEITRLEQDPELLQRRILEHIRDEVGALRGQIVEWDVVNEPYSNHEFMDVVGEEAMAEWFRAAREADPDAALFINDYDILASAGELDSAHQASYERTIVRLLEAGAPLDGIGMQSHIKWVCTGPEDLLTILDRFGRFDLRMVITEYDHDVPDEQLQADYLRDFLTTVFSHPGVTGFLMWGFWDGSHWLQNAPLYRRDWSPKPSGQVFLDLVFKEWWTKVDGETDAAGTLAVRGFLGDYQISAARDGARAGAAYRLERDGGAPLVLRLEGS